MKEALKQLTRHTATGKLVKRRLEVTSDGRITTACARSWGLATARTVMGKLKTRRLLPEGATPGATYWVLGDRGEEAYVMVAENAALTGPLKDCIRDSAAGVGVDTGVYLFTGTNWALFELTFPKALEWRVTLRTRKGQQPDIPAAAALRADVLRQVLTCGIEPNRIPIPFS